MKEITSQITKEADFLQTIQLVVLEMKYLNRNFRPVSNVILIKKEFTDYMLVVFSFEMLRSHFEIVPVSARVKITHFEELISLN